MANFDDMKLAVEALSGGKNTVLFDDMGMPSVMFPFVKQKYSDLMEGGTQETFPCFRIENEISIHALREERDRRGLCPGGAIFFISIHALREERDGYPAT